MSLTIEMREGKWYINNNLLTIPKDDAFQPISLLAGITEDPSGILGFKIIPLQVDASGYLLVKSV